jgi:hypothetical protein
MAWTKLSKDRNLKLDPGIPMARLAGVPLPIEASDELGIPGLNPVLITSPRAWWGLDSNSAKPLFFNGDLAK